MWCCMRPSIFGFKKLLDQREIENSNNTGTSINSSSQSVYDSSSITNNLDEFKILFSTQEKACYELRSEVTVLKMKLEVANEMIKSQSKKIQLLKTKKNKLLTENNVYKNILLYNSSFSMNSAQRKYVTNANDEQQEEKKHYNQNVAYPPPPPPPLPLPPPQNKLKINGNFQMNNVLDELKSKIKLIE